MKCFVVTADDFGLTVGVNEGIVEAHRLGIVTATSIMINAPAASHALAIARQTPALDLGIHANLTRGFPSLPPERVPSLVDGSGRFWSRDQFFSRAGRGIIAPADLLAEMDNQIRLALASGLPFTHLDSHHHVHAHPRVIRIAANLARRHGIPFLRRPSPASSHLWPPVHRAPFAMPGRPALLGQRLIIARQARLFRRSWRGLRFADHFVDTYRPGGMIDRQTLVETIRGLPDGIIEVNCHPGHVDAELRGVSSHTDARERELALFSDSSLRAELAELGVCLTSFRDLAAGIA